MTYSLKISVKYVTTDRIILNNQAKATKSTLDEMLSLRMGGGPLSANRKIS